MDCNKDYFCIEKNQKVFSKNIDIEEDFSQSLPAYCDDILRVVKCVSHFSLGSVCISQGEVMINGKCTMALTYYNENSSLCYADFEEDYSKSIAVDNLTDYAFAAAEISDKYTNFRVINQRRIDIHSSACISLSVYDKASCPCLKSCEGAKLKKETVKSADIIASNISKIEFDEEFSLPADNSAIGRIISSCVTANLTETKIIKDKVLVKAEVTANILYTDSDNNTISRVSNTFNISKIIEQSGIDENDIIICKTDIASAFHKAKTGSGDKLCVVEIFGEVSVNSTFIRENENEIVTDAYMIKYNNKCDSSDYNTLSDILHINESKMFSLELELPNGVNEIQEISVNLTAPQIRNAKLVSKAQTTVIYVNESGALTSASLTNDIAIDASGRENAVSSLSVKTADYNIADSKRVNLRLGVDINSYLYNNKVYKVISNIDMIDGKDSAPSLTLYFAKANENVWEIAKSFSSDTDLILSENELGSEKLSDDKILIIPRV